MPDTSKEQPPTSDAAELPEVGNVAITEHGQACAK
jgi:hypothetical protein